jgi:hypothetical protein
MTFSETKSYSAMINICKKIDGEKWSYRNAKRDGYAIKVAREKMQVFGCSLWLILACKWSLCAEKGNSRARAHAHTS